MKIEFGISLDLKPSLVGKHIEFLNFDHPANWDWNNLDLDGSQQPRHDSNVGGTIISEQKDGFVVECDGLTSSGEPCGYTEAHLMT